MLKNKYNTDDKNVTEWHAQQSETSLVPRNQCHMEKIEKNSATVIITSSVFCVTVKFYFEIS